MKGILLVSTTLFGYLLVSDVPWVNPESVLPPVVGSAKVYHINKLDDTSFDYANLDEEGPWSQAEALTDFTYPWREDTPPITTFRALCDDQYFYFLYEVVDTSLYVSTETGQETDVMNSDRVELFFLSNGTMNPYYCLEIDPHAQLFDYESRYYRKSNLPWTWPTGDIEIKALPYGGGYAIAGRISLTSLQKVGAIREGKMEVGLFRANVVGMTKDGPAFRWISWVRPAADEPDFHIPSAFGTLVLEP